MQNLNDIIKTLDGQPTARYTKLYGRYCYGDIVFNITNVYGGQVKTCDLTVEIPTERLYDTALYYTSDKTAISSCIMREFALCAHISNDTMQQTELNVQKGFFLVYKFGQRVLPNSVVTLKDDTVHIRLSVRLPFNSSAYNTGRRADEFDKGQSGSVLAMSAKAQRESFEKRQKGIISSHALQLLLMKNLPKLADNFIGQFNSDDLYQSVVLYRTQNTIRNFLRKNGYVSFLANGSVLPRKGKTDCKDPKNAVPFQSPPSLELAISLPDGEIIRGMGIRRGVTVITGDAYHGKSTILDAIREGVYNHVTGDGREYVITDESAASIQAEDGRSIRNTDISFFFKNLPIQGIEPESFSTANASGSTSQAAAVAEAIESGCRLMLFDEDRSANNFMYKDEKMRTVIRNASTRPFIDNARMLFDTFGISSIMVVGASGEYFRIADRVILVDKFAASEFTDYEKDFTKDDYQCRLHPRNVVFEELGKLCLTRNLSVQDNSTVKIGGETVAVPDILPYATRGQLDFICSFLYYLTVIEAGKKGTLAEAVNALYRKIDSSGVEAIHQTGLRGTGQIEYVRKYDMMNILYRLRCIGFHSKVN